MYCVVRSDLFVIEIFECVIKMDEDQWMHDSIMFEKVNMNGKKKD